MCSACVKTKYDSELSEDNKITKKNLYSLIQPTYRYTYMRTHKCIHTHIYMHVHIEAVTHTHNAGRLCNRDGQIFQEVVCSEPHDHMGGRGRGQP